MDFFTVFLEFLDLPELVKEERFYAVIRDILRNGHSYHQQILVHILMRVEQLATAEQVGELTRQVMESPDFITCLLKFSEFKKAAQIYEKRVTQIRSNVNLLKR